MISNQETLTLSPYIVICDLIVPKDNVLRKTIYQIDEDMKAKFPPKTKTDVLEDELDYCQKLIHAIEQEEVIHEYPKVKEKLNLLKEIINDHVEHLQLSEDPDARVGHKTADSSFFGYKTHLAMSEERIITAAVIATGEKSDGKQLETLIEKSENAKRGCI